MAVDRDLDILCRYNKPAVDPAVNPNRPNYERSLAEADRILAQIAPAPPNGPVGPSSVQYEDFRDPEPAGRFTGTPKGVILHGSRSGKQGNPKASEALATARYEQSNTLDLGWHATLGMRWVALHLTPREWGWHALQASKVYLGVEFAQATADEPIADEQVDAFVDWFRTQVLPVWPNLPLHFPSHAEADREFGVSQGKSDVFPLSDSRMGDLRARIMARLQDKAPEPGPSYSVGPGILTSMAEHGDKPASDEVFFKKGERDEWSEAFAASGARYIYLPSINRVFRYEPAA